MDDFYQKIFEHRFRSLIVVLLFGGIPWLILLGVIKLIVYAMN